MKSTAVVERLRLVVAYDGRPFAGWQSQANARGVQDCLESAFEKITGTHLTVHGSGRTDSGVHATGQIAHVDVPAGKHTAAVWQAALNANLPLEIRVMRVTRVPGGRTGFHARYDAAGKIYTYRIWNGPFLPPLEINRAWLMPSPMDPAAFAAAAQILTGTHDFASFAASRGREEPDTVRTIHSIRVQRRGGLYTVRFHGTGFLYKMVRLLTGTMVRIAIGRMTLEDLASYLAKPAQPKAHHAAPPEGLYLTRVFYPRRKA
jgi:tRNA pseudouridine38-40 synthase